MQLTCNTWLNSFIKLKLGALKTWSQSQGGQGKNSLPVIGKKQVSLKDLSFFKIMSGIKRQSNTKSLRYPFMFSPFLDL